MSFFGKGKKRKKNKNRETFGKKKSFFAINDYEDEYDEYEDEEYYEYEEYEDEESEEYYEDEQYEDEESEEYYEDEQYEDEESEEYYEDEQYEDEDSGEYYEYEEYEDEDSGEYYEDEQYEDEDSEEYYEEERYYEDDGEYEESEEYDEDDAVPYRKKKGIPAAILAFHRLPLIDKIIGCTGVAVLIFAVLTGVVFMAAKKEDREVRAFAEVGASLNGVGIIGESGLLAVADGRLAREAMAEITQETKEQEEVVKASVNVTMKMSSIVKDLKIKFVNKETDKLVANVPFQVEVTTASKKTETWTDDDKDGIIYKENIAPGNYKVKMLALTGYDDYQIPQETQSGEVKKDIVYKKVDVKEEIKTEAEVNAALEDAVVEKVVEESKLTDTVPFVQSTKISGAVSYKQIGKGAVKPPEIAAAIRTADYYLMISNNNTVTGGGQGGNDNTGNSTSSNQGGDQSSVSPNTPTTSEPTLTIDKTTLSITIGAKAEIKATSDQQTITWESTDSTVAAVTWTTDTKTATIEAKKAGSATIKAKMGGKEAVCTVTVPEDTRSITVDKTSVNVAVKKTADIKVTTVPGDAKITTVISADTRIAKVSFKDKTVTIEGVEKGKTKITIKCDNDKTVEVEAEVVNGTEQDTVSLLKDEKGSQVYVYENNAYRKAVYADYYKFKEFYVEDAPKTLYTGWQNINGKTYYYLADYRYVTGEQVIQGAKYTFASDGSLVTGSGTFGIDVSKWNGNIDWNSVKAGGVSYVMIRCGYRGSSTGALIEDPKFKANIAGANAAGINVGIYFFTQALNEKEAVEEASMTLELIKKYKISYPVFLDVESGGRANGIDKGTRTAVCKAYCETIQNSGYTAGIYANKTWLSSKMDAGALGAYKIWLAQYAAAPSYGGRYNLWQYSDKGSVPGIKGNVDLNLSYLGY